MPGERATRSPRLPPRWFVRCAWSVHRGLYRVTAGRIGLWRPKGNRWGAMRLTAIGRHTGPRRSVIVGYCEDGPNLVTMAMNGWGHGEPAWWLNLRARPDAEVRLAGGARLVPPRPDPPDLLVAGAPTHLHGLSTAASRRKAAETAAKDGSGLRLDPDAGGPGMRDWLQDIGHHDGLAAAFDTRVNGLAVLTAGPAAGSPGC
jgi:F420H(2)-dependent quinone reductase